MLIAEMFRRRQPLFCQPISNFFILFYFNFMCHLFCFLTPLGVTLPRRRRWRWRHLCSARCLQIERRCGVERTVTMWWAHRCCWRTYLSIWIIEETLWHGQHFDGYLLRLGGWLMDVSCNEKNKCGLRFSS